VSIAHPDVIERIRNEGWNKPWDMNFTTSQVPDLPPIPSQAPRPEGVQRALTGLADYITGDKWDFDQRGRGGQRQWDAPNDLTVTQGAEQGVREGGGILDRIGKFLGSLGVSGSPDAPADMQGTQMVRDPQTGEWVHPNVLQHWSRQ
tara:strand:+ start:648 stop:1088 length:441 start_codon:yes stop_codon:yes gene_type:complete